ncbi:DUF2867 domain-containing protein [Williamsia sp.]|uniref:DUF2867 domain-containing protein n=1 Tax=Williamsia sp. TaxID=1872085 RepID=UPI002F946051
MQPQPTPTRNILVTGATGYIGGRLAPRLVERGHDVRVLVRTPEKLSGAPWATRATVIKGDLSDPASLSEAFSGVDVVYHLVHSMGGTKDFSAEEQKAARNVVSAAQDAGVSRIVYLSGLHPSGVELSEHLSSRTEVGETLMKSGIETVVLQAGVVIGSGSASFEMIRHLTERLPVMTTPRWVHNKIQPIAVDDVLHFLIEAAVAEVPESRTWDVGGPDVLEYGDMMQIYAEVAGLSKRRMLVLPLLTPTLASRWVGTVTPIPGGLARPLVESLEHDAVVSEHDIVAVMAPPDGGLTPYRESVELALARIARAEVESSWANAAPDHPPSDPIPTDPGWAGEQVHTTHHSGDTTADPVTLWKSAEAIAGGSGWQIDTTEPGKMLRLRPNRSVPGTAWLQIEVSPTSGGSHLDLRTVFYPRGVVGRAYWFATLPTRRKKYGAMATHIIRQAESSLRPRSA